MNSIQISIAAAEDQQEILISQLSNLGVEGFEQTETHLIAYFNEGTFKSYEINEVLKDFLFTVNNIEEKNWNEVWENNFQPVIVEDFCAIRAEFHEAIPGVEHEIVITPKMSFGTGHHATTYMMMDHMRTIDFKNKAVFDFGTGTGILSILAEKLGAAKVFGIDVDHWSIANAKENIEKNNCSKILLQLTSQIPQESFDVILANINRNVLLQYMPELEDRLNKNGCLLLSGLLASDEKHITSASRLEVIKQSERNNWISLLFIK